MPQAPPSPSSVRNHLLAALSPADLARLRPGLQSVELSFDKTLHPAGGMTGAVLFPESGMVSLLATLEYGEQVEVGLAGNEGLVGVSLVLGTGHEITAARVQVQGTALRMDAAAVRNEMGANPAFRGLMLRYVQAFHAQVTLTAACNALHPIEQRLARWMLTAHDRAQGHTFAMTHEFMAMMLGVRRPGVSLAARVLQKAGLIRYVRGRMEITDRPGLEAASCGCYHTVRREFRRLLGADPAERHCG